MSENSNTTRLILLFLQSLCAPISVSYFYWALIVLILHRKNWSTPSVLIAMIHWIFCSLASFFSNLSKFYDNYEESKHISQISIIIYIYIYIK